MSEPRLIPGCLLSAALIVIVTLPVVAGTAYAARMLAGLLYQFGLR